MTNREKIKQLKKEIEILNSSILDRQQEFIKYLKKVRNNKITVEYISKEDWEIMLPEEKKANAFHYLLTLRTELKELIQEAKQKPIEVLAGWLDNPWVRVASALAGAVGLISSISSMGIVASPSLPINRLPSARKLKRYTVNNPYTKKSNDILQDADYYINYK